MDARKLIDFAMDEDGAEFRSQLYATLYDRTVAAMQERKQNQSLQFFLPKEDWESKSYPHEDYLLRQIRKRSDLFRANNLLGRHRFAHWSRVL